MRSEEPLEDGKLTAVKSSFSRSVDSIPAQNGSVHAAADGNSHSVAVSKEGVLESRPGFTPLRQLSMRRSRPSGEVEKELGAGSPSMTSRNISPLTPITPLRWKSSPREQEEEEKAMERSRFGMPRDEEDEPRGKAAGGGNEEEDRQGQQHQVDGAIALDRTKSVDELSTTAQAGNMDDMAKLEPTEGLDRKPSSVDDVMTMTLDFLRARLLSERAASKAAKLRVQQLASKVSELEQKLEQASADRKKAEVAAQEAFMKLKLAESSNQVVEKGSNEVADRSISNSGKGSPLSRSKGGEEDIKHPQQEMSSNEDLSGTNSCEGSVEDRDSTTKSQLSESVSDVEVRSAEQGRPVMKPPLQSMAVRSEESPVKQDSRAAIEIRLRNMWSKISEEMAALAEERSEEDIGREELIRWMDQVPSVLQDSSSKKLVSPTNKVALTSEIESTEPKSADTPPDVPPRSVADKGQPHAGAKRAALLHDEFAAQENVQQEWERNYHELKSDQVKEDDSTANPSPRSSTGPQKSDDVCGRNGGPDDPAFFRSSRARIAKSKSSLDLPTRSSEYNSDTSSPRLDGPSVEPDSWNRVRSQEQGSGSPQRDPSHQNTATQRSTSVEANHRNHGRMHDERSAAPSMRQEAWPGRQSDQESGLYNHDTGNRGGHPSSAERGSSYRSEDGWRRPYSDLRAGQPTWNDGDQRGSGGRPQQAQPGDIGREEFYSSPHPESTLQHQHSTNDDWLAADDYDQHPEPSAGLGRRQSYSIYPAPAASDLSRSSSDNGLGSYGDPRYNDERMRGSRGPRRESFPIAKAGQQYSSQVGRDGFSNTEPNLSLGYEGSREGSPVKPSPRAGVNKNISEVLRALQMAKANIQNGGAAAKEARLSGYGMETSAQYRQASRQAMPEQFRQPESQGPSRRSSLNPRYDPYEADFGSDRYQSEGDASGSTGADTSYADQQNVGKGIQFFFP